VGVEIQDAAAAFAPAVELDDIGEALVRDHGDPRIERAQALEIELLHLPEGDGTRVLEDIVFRHDAAQRRGQLRTNVLS
jgi:hypothetical protein